MKKVKKQLFVLLALILALSLSLVAGCSAPEETETPAETANEAPVAEEVKDVTIPEFSVLVNGVTVTQEELANYPVYSVQTTSIDSTNIETTATYVGFAMADVLKAAELTDKYVWLEAVGIDGYSMTFTGDVIYENTTLLAITKDGEQFTGAPWFAPGSNKATGYYVKKVATILVNTTEGKPDVSASPTDGGEAGTGGNPEILDRTDKVEFKAFTFMVNGQEVNNEVLAGQKIYKISATTTNSNGEAATADYTGYKLADVLAAVGLKDYKSVKVVANDGYESELDLDTANSEYTLLAIEKDKETGEDGTVWVAPCLESESKAYAKLVVEIKAE